MLRGIWDFQIDPKLVTFQEIIEEMVLGILCDFLPVTLLLIFHFRNFRVRKA